jgi:hypothetical protein
MFSSVILRCRHLLLTQAHSLKVSLSLSFGFSLYIAVTIQFIAAVHRYNIYILFYCYA